MIYRTPVHSEVELIQKQLLPFLCSQYSEKIKLLRVGITAWLLFVHCVLLCANKSRLEIILPVYVLGGSILLVSYVLSKDFRNRKDIKAIRTGALEVAVCSDFEINGSTVITCVSGLHIAVDCYNMSTADIATEKAKLLLCRLSTNSLYIVRGEKEG